MFAAPILQQGESEDQTECPESEKRDHGKRAEVSEKCLAAGLRLDVAGQPCPGSPGIAVKPAGYAKLALHPARQDDGFKRVEQDGEKDDRRRENSQSVHCRSVWLKAGMVADLGTRYFLICIPSSFN